MTIHGGGRGRISSGRTVGVHGVGRIAISVGDAATPADLKTNWELVHEMVHLAFPSMTDARVDRGRPGDVRRADRARPRASRARRGHLEVARLGPAAGAGRGRRNRARRGEELGSHLLGRRALLLRGGPGDPAADGRTPVARRRPPRDRAARAETSPSSGPSRRPWPRATARPAFPSSKSSMRACASRFPPFDLDATFRQLGIGGVESRRRRPTMRRLWPRCARGSPPASDAPALTGPASARGRPATTGRRARASTTGRRRRTAPPT